ncbi:hypothetical protein [Blastococcus sp. LR1]|uniref:hypothetical protein n=1 Tax=Blastococcus sp. LR1 TaxID=2877000 RepID=UPI001CCD7AE3|nr:hypothetical protein [Blastococcus sp. LR1]MCA0144354.1 hypothetical protein [Blastococcus sp. LR1]
MFAGVVAEGMDAPGRPEEAPASGRRRRLLPEERHVRIALLTCGTRGDAQPLAVLALELERRGRCTASRSAGRRPTRSARDAAASRARSTG